MNRWMAPPMWGRPMKDVQEGNPTTHDMASHVLAGVRLSSEVLQVGVVK
ncbi:hypothetical protein LINPERHAP2_LOCUS3065 [Linum perenne]